MEVLLSAPSVRLRSCDRGLYLAAEEHGGEVFLAGGRAAPNTVWGVHAFPDGEPAVLLRSAYGRYLLASEVRATTGPSGAATVTHVWYPLARQSPLPCMLWQAVRRQEPQDGVMIRNCAGSFLRANGRYLRWRRAVTVAGDSSSSMMRWTIEVVPMDWESSSVLDGATLRTLLQITNGKLAQQLSLKDTLQKRMHRVRKRMEANSGARPALAPKAHDSLVTQMAKCDEAIRELQDEEGRLEAAIQQTTPPRRWSW